MLARRPVVISVLALSASLPGVAQAEEKATTAAILEAAEKIGDLRVLRKVKALEALFTEDADMVDVDGSFRRGRPAVVSQILESVGKDPTPRRFTPGVGVRLVGSDVAMVDGEYRRGRDDRRMWATVVLRRTPDGWRITAVRILREVSPVRP